MVFWLLDHLVWHSTGLLVYLKVYGAPEMIEWTLAFRCLATRTVLLLYFVKREWIKVVELSMRGMKVSYVCRDIYNRCWVYEALGNSVVAQQALGSHALCRPERPRGDYCYRCDLFTLCRVV